ncbi:MAG: VWA domain-containing protein [Acidobacteriota bacterium]
MTLGTQTKRVAGRVGKIALLLAAATGLAPAQSTTQTAQTQQSVPNAPEPQALPELNTITPVGLAQPSTSAAAPTRPAAKPAAAPEAADEEEDQQQGPPPASTQSALNTLSVHVQFHEIPFLVKDSKGNLVPGITWRDVRVYENGVRQQIRVFTSDPAPLAVALVIDQGVTHDTMEKINDSLDALQGAFSPWDEVSVFTYNDGVTEQTAFTAAQSPRLGAVLDNSKGVGRDPLMGLTGPLSHGAVINNMPIDGVTDFGHQPGTLAFTVPKEYHTLNDAILKAAKEVSTAPRGRRRIIYVISDGKEYGSQATQKEVIRYLLTNNISVWATQVGDSAIPGVGFLDRMHIPLTMRDDVLPTYAAKTGGEFDSEFRPRGIEQAFMQITNQIRAQYTVGYYTNANPYDESYRRTEIRILRPGLTIICKDGYYPSAADNAAATPVHQPAPQ